MKTNLFITRLARDAQRHGGHLRVVGGAVRDHLRGQTSIDFDLELGGMTASQAKRLLQRHGQVQTVGRAFGVFLVHHHQQTYEVALPRRDSRVSAGHRGFHVTIDPHLSVRDAARRRDFTINALSADPLSGKIIDPFDGRHDLRHHLLRAVDLKTLGDDPLRLQRAFQFAARFKLSCEPATKKVLRRLVARRDELPGDRKRQEWLKLILSDTPAIGVKLAIDLGYIPRSFVLGRRLHRLDVFSHLATTYKLPADERVDGFFVVLFGAQVPIVIRWLRGEGFSAPVISSITKLAKTIDRLDQKSRPSPSWRTVANLAAPLTLRAVVITAAAQENAPARVVKIKTAHRAIWSTPPSPIISGRDLLARHWVPSPLFGQIQAAAEGAFDHGISVARIKAIIRRAVSPGAALAALKS